MKLFKKGQSQERTETESPAKSEVDFQARQFYKIYKLLRVKKSKDLRFSKKTKAELKRKFAKLSKVGI